MPKRMINFEPNCYYHIYNRGCSKGRIFFERSNYIYLLSLIKKYCTKFNISVIAYCLLPNHYHFLFRQNSNDSAGKAVQNIFNSYVKAINKKYKRSGTLFEGKFNSKEITRNDVLLEVCRYIHRNPVDDKLVKNIEEWEYSNYLEWIGKRNGLLVDHDIINSFFLSGKEYEKFVLEYYSKKQASNELAEYLRMLRKCQSPLR